MKRSTVRTTRKTRKTHKASSSAAVLLAALGGFCAALAALGTADAHAAYAASTPAFAAVLDAAPERIELRFTQQLFRREDANRITLERSDDDASIALGEIEIDNVDRASMRAELLAPLRPGRYLVGWQNLSADDGDSDRGSYPFYVGRSPTAAEQAADRALAAELLIPYPGDEPAEPATETALEQRPPTVVRREAEPTGGVAASAIVWLALGGGALLTVGASWLRRGRAT